MTDKIYWLSFCDDDRPKGQQFLGVAIVRVTEADMREMAGELVFRFPTRTLTTHAAWIAAATRRAWLLGCNPGGQILSMEVDPVHAERVAPHIGRLMQLDELHANGLMSLERVDMN